MGILKTNVTDVVGQYEGALSVFNKAKRKLEKAISNAQAVQQRKLDEAEKLREEAVEIEIKASAKTQELRVKAKQQESDVSLLDKHILRMNATISNIDSLVGGR